MTKDISGSGWNDAQSFADEASDEVEAEVIAFEKDAAGKKGGA